MKKYVSDEICQMTVDAWGKQSQILMLLEEMSELQKEILKNINRGRDNLNELAEETADVLIMAERLIYIYQMKDKVDAAADMKVKRLKTYLGIK